MLAYSVDLRKRVVAAYERGATTIVEIGEQFAVGQTFVKKMLRQYRGTGDLAPLPQRAGAKKRLTAKQRSWLQRQVEYVPEATITELQERLRAEKQALISRATVCRELQAIALPRKKRV